MILVAPTSFKGTLTASDATRALAAGARDACPSHEVIELPVSDGGPGLIEALHAARGGELRTTRVPDPLGRDVDARILVVELEGGTAAVVESADAVGMHLLAPAELDPLRLGSAGVGALIEAASACADTVVVGLGGSATVDGGVGMAAALGWRFLDATGRDLEPGGAALRRLERIVAPSARRPGRVVALADVRNPLIGTDGAARVYGPQKGATEDDVEVLEHGLARLTHAIRRDVGIDVAAISGSGAAGGLGAACAAFLGAGLEPGSDWVLRAVGFDERLARASLVITGEGSWDAQSSLGKVTGAVVARATAAGTAVVVCVGRFEGAAPAAVRVAAAADGAILDGPGLREMAAHEVTRIAPSLGC